MDDNNYIGCFPRVVAAVLIVVLILLSGCKPYERIVHDNTVVYFHDTIKSVLVDSVIINNEIQVYDSVYVNDSSMVRVDSLGNVTREYWHYKFMYKWNESKYELLKSKYDSLSERKDSISYVTRVEVVERKPTLIEKLKMDLSFPALIVACIMTFSLIYRLRREQ